MSDDTAPYELLRLHQRVETVRIGPEGEHVLGTEKSRHSRSSFVLAKEPSSGDTKLAFIQFFSRCTAKKASNEQESRWVVAVSWYELHPCKVWFGKPTEVWTTTIAESLSFILIENIVSRVVYVKEEVYFGANVGRDVVYVVVPLI